MDKSRIIDHAINAAITIVTGMLIAKLTNKDLDFGITKWLKGRVTPKFTAWTMLILSLSVVTHISFGLYRMITDPAHQYATRADVLLIIIRLSALLIWLYLIRRHLYSLIDIYQAGRKRREAARIEEALARVRRDSAGE